jgi:flagellar FliL protein
VSAKPEAPDAAAAPAKSKKMLIIIVAAVLVLAIGGGGAFFVLKKKAASADEEAVDDHAPAATAAHDKNKAPPEYLPMDNMVVNLANPGGERVAQIGVTLELLDKDSAAAVKGYMPSIRSGVLQLVAKRTAEELLSPEGKEQLTQDILRETSIPFGGGEEEEEAPTKKTKKKKAPVQYPVVAVHYSSFIVQ